MSTAGAAPTATAPLAPAWPPLDAAATATRRPVAPAAEVLVWTPLAQR